MDVGLMIEGQNNLSWERWIHILHLAERLGIPSVFRSDHYFTGNQEESLEAFISLAVAARETSTIRFGPLVTPVTFRPPVEVARMAAQIDLLSGGRLALGVGNGWHEGEHKAYGVHFPPPGERTGRLEEAIQLMKALWAPGTASFQGKYYTLDGAEMLPKPAAGRPYLVIGGSGPQKTLRMVARYADEWNSVNGTPELLSDRNDILARHCEAEGRDPATIKRSTMHFALAGPDAGFVDRSAAFLTGHMPRYAGMSTEQALAATRERGGIVGDTDEVVEALGRLAQVGVSEVQFQHLFYEDDTFPQWLAEEVAPRVRNL